MRRCSTLMEFISVKMIENERLIVQLSIPKMVSGKNESFRKRLWFGSEFVLKVLYPPLVIFEDGTIDHDRCIKEVLLVALKFGNDMLGTDWTFQPDSAKAHIHAKSQKWCDKHCPCFIDKEH